MKAVSALLFALSAALTLATPTPAPAPEEIDALAARGEHCPIPPPNLEMVDRIYRVARNRKVNSKVMLAMFETAYVESRINNLNCGDKDSVGIFQQRHSQNWGTVAQIMNPEYSTNKFLDRCIQVDKEKPWLSTGQLAQAVQISEFPDRYDQVEGEARKYLNIAIQRNGGYSSGGSSGGSGGAINVGGNPNNGGGNSNTGGSSGSCAKTYTVKSGDTCSKLASAGGISLDKFYSLNSGKVNGKCTNLQIGVKYCIGGGKAPATTTPPKNNNGNSGKAGVPSNLASGTTKSCSKYHTVQSGDVCSKLASLGGISVQSLYTLNNGINKSSCNNLQIGKAYCVKP